MRQQAGLKTYLQLLGTQRQAVSLETNSQGKGLLEPLEVSAMVGLSGWGELVWFSMSQEGEAAPFGSPEHAGSPCLWGKQFL